MKLVDELTAELRDVMSAANSAACDVIYALTQALEQYESLGAELDRGLPPRLSRFILEETLQRDLDNAIRSFTSAHAEVNRSALRVAVVSAHMGNHAAAKELGMSHERLRRIVQNA